MAAGAEALAASAAAVSLGCVASDDGLSVLDEEDEEEEEEDDDGGVEGPGAADAAARSLSLAGGVDVPEAPRAAAVAAAASLLAPPRLPLTACSRAMQVYSTSSSKPCA